tara:strand:+ start:1128 stop:1229 length:102 start_codon:yes stop_codon:yes gene_type:complete
MNEYVGTILLIAAGVAITYYQVKLTEYDPDKDF